MSKRTSLLIGAGFSVGFGYPTARELSDKILNTKGTEFGFSTGGNLCVNTQTGGRPDFGFPTSYDVALDFCLDLIKGYHSATGSFDYEQFFDFFHNVPSKHQPLVDKIAAGYIGSHYPSSDSLLRALPNIYHQIVGFYLKDGEGNWDYENAAHSINAIPGYSGVLECFRAMLSDDGIIDTHTLNHDLLFERLNRTDALSGEVTDGFEELGSPFYGKLLVDGRSNMVRLSYYSGNYNGRCRLYKLHGSVNYVKYSMEDGGATYPERFVKTKYGVGLTNLYREITDTSGALTYHNCWINYHGFALTGTTSKLFHYSEPILITKLFDLFKSNLASADKLVIIGYGGRDSGINDILKNHFDHVNKDVYVVDPFPGSELKQLVADLGATLVVKDMGSLTPADIGE